MQFQILYSYDAISGDDWGRLTVNRSAFQQAAWYRAAESSGSLRLYVATDDRGRPVLALPAFRLERRGHYYSSPSLLLTGDGEVAMLRERSMSLKPLDRAREAPWYPAVVTMSPYGYRGGVLAAPEANRDMLGPFIRFVLDSCSDEGVRVVSFHYLVEQEDSDLLDILIAHNGTPAVLGASCILPLRWSTPEDYLSWLGPSRRTVGRDYRRADRRPETYWTASEDSPPAADAELVTQMFAATMRRHGECDIPVSLLHSGAAGVAGTSVHFYARDAFGLRSALLALRQGGTLYPKFFGTNRERGDYFPLGYWNTLRYAISSQLRSIDFGGGATRAKLWRGADIYWDLGVFFFLDPRLRAVAEPLSQHLSAANHAYFTELAERWSHRHAAPLLPDGLQRSIIG